MSEDGFDPEGRTLSVIVPVFDERDTVVEVLRRMRRVELPVHLEIVVVDDGSTDGTSQILAALEDSTVPVVRHPTNLGKGAAVRTGLRHVRGELVLIRTPTSSTTRTTGPACCARSCGAVPRWSTAAGCACPTSSPLRRPSDTRGAALDPMGRKGRHRH